MNKTRAMVEANSLRNRRGFLFEVKKSWQLLLMLAIPVALVFVFCYLPMPGIILAFKDYRFNLGIFGSRWVGMKNFEFFFASGDAYTVTRNTVLYNLAFIVVTTVLQLLFSVVLSEMGGKRYKKTLQSVMLLPYFVSWVIVASVFYNMFNYEYGLVNSILVSMGLERINIYTMASTWPFILIFFKAWKTVGYGTVIFLAAIAGIDVTLHEAAEVDGANIFQRIWHITIPGLIPTVVLLTLLNIGQVFRGDFGLFYQLVGYNGNLFDVTDVIDTYVYRALEASSNMGMVAAIGLYQSVLCFVTIMITNYAVKKVQPEYVLF